MASIRSVEYRNADEHFRERYISTCRIPFVLCFATAFLLHGCASPEAKWAKAQRMALHAVPYLEERADADSLAAAATLEFSKEPIHALALMARASGLSTARPDLVWLQLAFCLDTSGCDPEPIENHLRAIDSNNGVGWLGALERADSSGNESARDTALIAISRTERVDTYWTTLISRLVGAAIQDKKMPLETASALIIGVLSARAIPRYTPASKSCKGDRLQRIDTVDICRRVASALQRGDTILSEMIGNAITIRVWPPNSEEFLAATASKRVYNYRSDLYLKLITGPKAAVASTQEYLMLCSIHRREQDVLRAQITAAGGIPDPPGEQAT